MYLLFYGSYFNIALLRRTKNADIKKIKAKRYEQDIF